MSTLRNNRCPRSQKYAINEDYAWIYESIFDSPGIRNAFSENYSPSQLGKATPSALETTPVNAAGVKSKVSKPKHVQSRGDLCTVDQILKMNKLGLDDGLIKAACSN